MHGSINVNIKKKKKKINNHVLYEKAIIYSYFIFKLL